MNPGQLVTDERGAPHYYRVLPTEPTFRQSLLLRVQPLRRWKDGSYHERGEPQIIGEQFLKEVSGETQG